VLYCFVLFGNTHYYNNGDIIFYHERIQIYSITFALATYYTTFHTKCIAFHFVLFCLDVHIVAYARL